MRERQPIDDLFARALRDANAEPPAAAWAGILSKRDRMHVALLRIERRWWIIPLVLFFAGGAVGYMTSYDARVPSAELVQGEMKDDRISTGDLDRVSSTSADVLVQRSDLQDLTAMTIPGSKQSEAHEPSQQRSNKVYPSVTGPQMPVLEDNMRSVSGSVATKVTGLDRSVRRSIPNSRSSQMRVIDPSSRPIEETRADDRMIDMTTAPSAMESALAEVVPIWMDGRGTLPERSVMPLTPIGRVASPVALSKGYWWVAAEVGRSAETRTWHDDDQELMNELNGTETTHHPFHLGAVGGFTYLGGWGFSSGISFTVGRYDFRHVDRIMHRRDSISSYIITFNNEVIADYSDTLTLITEEDNTVSSVNQYASVVVPLNVSWYRPCRRWKLGLRGGIAVEINTLRSGVMLSTRQYDGSVRSVDVSEMERRTSALISGVVAADVGYALNERIVVWLSPSYAHGLFPLVSPTGSLYAIPERGDLSLRLSYTLGPR